MSHLFENVPLLLVTGQGRSGTTVLTKAVAKHPQIYSNRVESNVMKDVLLAGRASCTMPSRQRQMVLPRDQHDRVFRNMLLDLLFPVQAWAQAEPPSALSTFSAMEPEAAEFAVSVFPGIRFANIVRHGVEVVASRMVHRSLGQHSFEEHCHAWAAAREMAEWGDQLNSFTLIRHENFLDQKSCSTMFSKLFAAIELDDSDNSSNYVLQNRFNQTSYDGEGAEDRSNLLQRQKRWSHWSDEQQNMFTEICGPTMQYFGYAIPK